jgi:hypothetical protein
MAGKFSPSVNIIRDSGRRLDYVITPNAEHIAREMGRDYRNGFRSFTVIGSYGTGKSSFLMALERSIKGESLLGIDLGFRPKKVESLRIVGQYQSLIAHFHELFDIHDDFEGNQKIFDHLYQLAKGSDLLVVYLDEFGKFLEYGSKHGADKELYFLQQLAEFVNDHDKEILLVSTLHQNFEAYSTNMAEESQKREWRKVKGRFKELTFNEPVEQLLFLAAQKLEGKGKGHSRLALAKAKKLLPFASDAVDAFDTRLAPLDIISAAVLTKALQVYGQNERSLFTFLESDLRDDEWVDVSKVYDYLFGSFYSQLNSGHNQHYRHWQGMQSGVERIELGDFDQWEVALAVFKSIGLLQLFASKAASLDSEMLCTYFDGRYVKKDVEGALKELAKRKLIVFARYNNSYKLIEGTDVDFDQELIRAGEAVDRGFNVTSLLTEHFDFPVLMAKEVSYRKGTPRLFRFEISEEPQLKLQPTGEIDGYINLVFNDRLQPSEVQKLSKRNDGMVLYGFFTNSKSIQDHLFEILKTKKVLADNEEDFVAKQEFEKIQESHKRLLNHEVQGSLFSERVRWFCDGEEVQIGDHKALNAQLSNICNSVYSLTPRLDNELMNKHKISSSIHTARKLFLEQLVDHWEEEELGFEKDKFPPERSIYRSLLLNNGMHRFENGAWDLVEPNSKHGFQEVWQVSWDFLEESRREPRSLNILMDTLRSAPFKLKQGLIDFWVPTFLFINRGDFALFEQGRFTPHLTAATLNLVTKNPKDFQVKAFEITGFRLQVFNKYREFLQQKEQTKLSQAGFIESVRPFLIFYRDLNDYAKRTNQISQEAIALRSAIMNAQDPEQTFFEAFPKALGIEITDTSDAKLSEFAVKLNEAVEELKAAYAELLNRLEGFICQELLGKRMEFEGYRKALSKRVADIQEHRLLPKQKSFIARVKSPIDDRDSWLASIAQAVLGKPLTQIEDSEELVLFDRLRRTIEELDNLQVLHKMKAEEGEQVYKLDITTSDGVRTQNVRIPKAKAAEVEKVTNEVEQLLQKNNSLTLAVLSRLLQKALDK